jgi:hypothetical protein
MPSPPPSPRRWCPDRRRTGAVVVLLALGAGGCTMVGPGVAGSGTITESVREVEYFTEIEVGAAIEAALSVGSAESVVVRTDDNVQALVTVEVIDDRLVIGVDGPVRTATLEADITVPADALTAVELTGAASLTGTDALTSDGLDVVASGASRVFLVVETDQVDVDASGASVVNLAGSADALDGRVSGASSAQLSELPVATAVLDVSGASRASVDVRDRLQATASGASSVLYRGDPATVESDVDGGSSVQPDESGTSE